MCVPPSRRLVGALVALVLLVAGCSGGEGDDPAPAPATSSAAAAELPLPVARPTTRTLRVAPEPVWRSPAATYAELGIIDDLAVFTGQPGSDDAAIGVDLSTGRELWRVDLGDVVPGTSTVQLGGIFALQNDSVVTAPTPGGPVVLLPYRDYGCEYGCSDRGAGQPLGVVALDARTGRAVWGRGLVDADAQLPSRLLAGSDMVDVTAASAQVVVAEVGSSLVVDRPYDDADERSLPVAAVGLDPATGRRLWVREGTHPLDLVGDVVLAIEHRARTRLLGLDARTGEVRWRGGEVFSHDAAVEGGLLESVSPDLLAVGVGQAPPRLLDPATGRDLPEQLVDGASICSPWRGGPVLLVCLWPDPERPGSRLVTVGDGGRQVLSATTTEALPEVATGGVVGLLDISDRGVVVDPSGRRAARLGGRLVQVQGPWVVVARGDDDRPRLVVLRRR